MLPAETRNHIVEGGETRNHFEKWFSRDGGGRGGGGGERETQ
jgi:hypothetical protein